MPNHVRNVLTLDGSAEDIKAIVEQFGTVVERHHNKTYDGRLICQRKDKDGMEYGWHDEEKHEFSYRSNGKVIDTTIINNKIPEGWEYDMVETFTQFPDFQKVLPAPEGLDIESGSLGDNAYTLLFGSDKQFISTNELQKRFSELSEEQMRKSVDLAIKYFMNEQKYGYRTWYEWNSEHWGTKWNSYDCEQVSDNEFIWDTAWSCVYKLIKVMSEAFPEVIFRYEYSDEDTGSNCGTMTIMGGSKVVERIPVSGSKEAYDLAFKHRPDNQEYYKLVDGNWTSKED